MNRRLVWASLIILLSACDTFHKSGGSTANARLKDDRPVDVLKADIAPPVVVSARCREVTKVSEEQSGNWIRARYLVRFDVEAVEQGTWSDPQLCFIANDEWPAPGSGLIVDKAVFPYRVGVLMRFGLETGRTPALIVQQESVSVP